jgi:hypothetical protein
VYSSASDRFLQLTWHSSSIDPPQWLIIHGLLFLCSLTSFIEESQSDDCLLLFPLLLHVTTALANINEISDASMTMQMTTAVEDTENTASHYCCIQLLPWKHAWFAKPFLSNGCLCWLHSSCLEQMCHNIVM